MFRRVTASQGLAAPSTLFSTAATCRLLWMLPQLRSCKARFPLTFSYAEENGNRPHSGTNTQQYQHSVTAVSLAVTVTRKP